MVSATSSYWFNPFRFSPNEMTSPSFPFPERPYPTLSTIAPTSPELLLSISYLAISEDAADVSFSTAISFPLIKSPFHLLGIAVPEASMAIVSSHLLSSTDGSHASGVKVIINQIKIMNELSNGSISTSTSPFNGTIDDVEFYNGVTTATPATWNEDMTGVTSALTVDNFTVGTSTQSSSTGTESHTVSASSKEKKILLVTVRTGGVDSTISSCTYAGVAMTSLGTDTTGAGNYTRHTCFYLLNPPTGTADIVATKSNSSAHCKIVALSLYGAKQTAPTFAVNAGSYSPSSGITTNITPPANSWVYSTLSGSSPTNSTNDPPSTYYTNDELTVLNSDTSVTKKKYGLKKDPTTGSVNAVQMYFKHPANNNNQPVVLSVFAVEPLG